MKFSREEFRINFASLTLDGARALAFSLFLWIVGVGWVIFKQQQRIITNREVDSVGYGLMNIIISFQKYEGEERSEKTRGETKKEHHHHHQHQQQQQQ